MEGWVFGAVWTDTTVVINMPSLTFKAYENNMGVFHSDGAAHAYPAALPLGGSAGLPGPSE